MEPLRGQAPNSFPWAAESAAPLDTPGWCQDPAWWCLVIGLCIKPSPVLTSMTVLWSHRRRAPSLPTSNNLQSSGFRRAITCACVPCLSQRMHRRMRRSPPKSVSVVEVGGNTSDMSSSPCWYMNARWARSSHSMGFWIYLACCGTTLDDSR